MKHLLVATLFLPACTVVVAPFDEQCTESSDCEARGFANAQCQAGTCVAGELSGPWGCLDREDSDEVPTGTVIYKPDIRMLNAETAVPGLIVSACRDTDPTCESPLTVAEGGEGTTIEIEVPEGFEGYFEVVSETALPTLIDLTRPLMRPEDGGPFMPPPMNLPTPTSLAVISSFASVEVGGELGHALIAIEDCEGNRVSGASVNANREASGANPTQVFYIHGTIPTLENETDETGSAGFINLPTGFISLEAIERERGVIGEGTVTIRPGTMTITSLGPR